MEQLDWRKLVQLANQKVSLRTKTNIPFQIIDSTENTLIIRVSSGNDLTISRVNLEKAVQKLRAGVVISGPQDYKDKVADDRPAYAWAILRELGCL